MEPGCQPGQFCDIDEPPSRAHELDRVEAIQETSVGSSHEQLVVTTSLSQAAGAGPGAGLPRSPGRSAATVSLLASRRSVSLRCTVTVPRTDRPVAGTLGGWRRSVEPQGPRSSSHGFV
jgi:hypothetical protein